MKTLLIGGVLAALAGCSGSSENGCDEAMAYLNKAQKAYDATEGMAPDMRAHAAQALELAWIAVPLFCEDRPAVAP
jgi:hypothetical protein